VRDLWDLISSHGISFGLVPLAMHTYRSSISQSSMRKDLVHMFTTILAAMSQQRSVRSHSVHVPDLDATSFRPIGLNRSESADGVT